MQEITINWAWWVMVIEAPALAGMLWLIILTRANLANYKLEVADKYATTSHLHEVEARIADELAVMNKTLAGLARDVNRMQGAREGPRKC